MQCSEKFELLNMCVPSSVQTVNKQSFMAYLVACFFVVLCVCVCVLFLVILLFKMTSKHSAEMLSGILGTKRL